MVEASAALLTYAAATTVSTCATFDTSQFTLMIVFVNDVAAGNYCENSRWNARWRNPRAPPWELHPSSSPKG